MEDLIKLFDLIEKYPTTTVLITGFLVFLKDIVKTLFSKFKNTSDYIKPVFWTFGKKYKIVAVHQYEISDSNISGFKHLGQNSRPDQYNKLIKINSSFLNLRHEIIPLNKEDILTVVISRDGQEKDKCIDFNK